MATGTRRRRRGTGRCLACGGPGGEWGQSQPEGIPLCYDCYGKIFGHRPTLQTMLIAFEAIGGEGASYEGEIYGSGRWKELDDALTGAGCVGQARRDMISTLQRYILWELQQRDMNSQRFTQKSTWKMPRFRIDNCMIEWD